jgi:PPOX class probable F420-dependent enzyme
MPGYGISESREGLLPWSWAVERLQKNRNFWVSTTRPDGRPHAMPVWAVWHSDSLYFSTGRTSVKARNLLANPACTATTEPADEAVILEGVATVEEDHDVLRPIWEAYKAKYNWDIAGESMFVLRPRTAFAFIETAEQFATAATRWTFPASS